MDDIIVTGDDHEEIQNLKSKLTKEFKIKDLGSLRYFLGIEVAWSKEGLYVSQRKYILDLLEHIGMLSCKPLDTPIDHNNKLRINLDGVLVDERRYQRLVGKLIETCLIQGQTLHILSVSWVNSCMLP